MKRSALPLQFLASAATTTASMSSRSSYRGGRKQWGRGFSVRPYNHGRGQQIVTGDLHSQSFQDSNLGSSQAGSGGFNPRQLPPPPRFIPNQQFRQPPPFVQNQNSQFRGSPRFDQNSQAIRSPQQFRPRPPKPLDYRDWEYAKTRPPPDSEKFIVLSYNILADYLAFNHRSKLYFHIPRYMLDWEWRKRSILFELKLWSADIMCLQEVDRFQDLAEELKLRGYDGIWKMRTGNAVDGCAIFWRTSRFKLLYEESIEFNKLGLRDNVAQICVLEKLTNRNRAADTSDLPISSESYDKVVVCNIHVLYNPRRGEIKLGQVRTLLEKANAVAKMWDAPVVLCGDFNCTPKSPLYNFISEQKLELSGIDRDKVSGQASAEISASSPRNSNSNPNPNPNANPIPSWSSPEKSNQGPIIANNKVNNSAMDMQKQNNPYNKEIIPTIGDSSELQSVVPIVEVSDSSLSAAQLRKVDTEAGCVNTKETQQDVIDNCYKDSASTMSVLADNFNKASVTDYSENRDPGTKKVAQPIGVPLHDSSHHLPSQPVGNDENADSLTPSQAKISSIPPRFYYEGENGLNEASPRELNIQLEGEMVVEDQDRFLSELQISSQPDSSQSGQSDSAANQNEFASESIDCEVDSPNNEVLNDLSNDLDSDSFLADRTAYDPSLWTPEEVAIASGNADFMVLEHPLKLKSSYAEVELQDRSETRDPNGEPLVTSYNRCFFGTVDYIWSSEGLQTVRVLAPIPKHAMQRTPGFPTKKWGSDHIALASELAFTKDATNKSMVVEHLKD